jgi:hypothetical protein
VSGNEDANLALKTQMEENHNISAPLVSEPMLIQPTTEVDVNTNHLAEATNEQGNLNAVAPALAETVSHQVKVGSLDEIAKPTSAISMSNFKDDEFALAKEQKIIHNFEAAPAINNGAFEEDFEYGTTAITPMPIAPSQAAVTFNPTSMEADDDDEVVMDANHPLMKRVQVAIFEQLSKHEGKLILEIREKVSPAHIGRRSKKGHQNKRRCGSRAL